MESATNTRKPYHKVLILVIVASISFSCARKVYIPREHVVFKTDTIYRTISQIDSVVDRDTVITTVTGDTLKTEITKWRWRVKTTHDTLWKSRVDSIFVEKSYPVEKYVETNRLHLWQKLLIWSGILALTYGGVTIYRRIFRKR